MTNKMQSFELQAFWYAHKLTLSEVPTVFPCDGQIAIGNEVFEIHTGDTINVKLDGSKLIFEVTCL